MAVKLNCEKHGKYKYYRSALLIGYDSEGKKVYKDFYGKSKGEAELKRDEYKNNLKIGLVDDNSSVNKAFKEWLFTVILPSGIKSSTFEVYESIYRLYIKDSELSFMKVKDVKLPIIQNFMSDMYNKGKKYPLLSKTYKLIKRFFNYQIEKDIILKNPCNGVKIPGQIAYMKEKNIEEIEAFTSKERDLILKYLYSNNERIAGIAYLGFSLGMREGEILALSWKDVDLKKRILHIKKSIRLTKDFDNEGKEIGKSIKITMPKTMSSVRDISFTKEFDNMFKIAKQQNNKDKLKAGELYDNKYNLVFTDSIGNPLTKRYVLRHWESALRELEIEYRPFHKLRHTFITQMARDGVPEAVTQAIVGHKKGSEITRKIYTLMSKEDTKKALQNYRITVPK